MKAVIAGAGTYGAVYHYYLKEQGLYDIIAFLDDNKEKIGKKIDGLEVLCELRDFRKLKELNIEAVFCPIGNNIIRRNYLRDCEKEGFNIPGFIHKSAIVPKNIKTGKGVYILPGSKIMPFVEILDFVMISMGVNIAHHTVLHEASFISTGANIGANIDFGHCAFAGIGSTITTGVKRIGESATIGAGAVIIRNVPDHAVVVGNPGKELKK